MRWLFGQTETCVFVVAPQPTANVEAFKGKLSRFDG